MRFFFVVLFLLAVLTLPIDAKMQQIASPPSSCHPLKTKCTKNSDCCSNRCLKS
ncbi:hypothetical protein ABPG74_004893, partial [Tetrahymena malaccensis]